MFPLKSKFSTRRTNSTITFNSLQPTTDIPLASTDYVSHTMPLKKSIPRPRPRPRPRPQHQSQPQPQSQPQSQHQPQPPSQQYQLPSDNSIKQIYIFTRSFTKAAAKLISNELTNMNIETTLFYRDITNDDIEICNNDPNLYLFILNPQFNLARPGKNLILLPKNKYFLYQLEQLNQTEYPYQSVDIIIDAIENSYCTFDYSTTNLLYYPERIREKIRINLQI